MTDPKDPDEWQFGLDEVGPEGAREESELRPLEPGSPSLENVVFVLLGVVGALALLFVGLSPF